MFVSVGSLTNNSDIPQEENRADILQYNIDGSGFRIFASGLRNAVGLAIDPTTGQLWASVNERDELGDNLPPDYITHVQDGGFYGWPWYYIGNHPDPKHIGKHPELAAKVIVPDVLIQAHSASLWTRASTST
jgi:glucose/arabinose dehydrogenase